MSLRARLALAFAAVSLLVAAATGLLSFHAAASRITDANDTTLAAAGTSLAAGETGVLATPSGTPADRRGGGDPEDAQRGQTITARLVAADGTVTVLGSEPPPMPVTPAALALARDPVRGDTQTSETTVDDTTYRVLTMTLADGRGALQVALNVELSRRVLGGMAIEITWVSSAILVVTAIAGWLLAGRITRRLVRLAGTAQRVSVHGGIGEAVPVEGRDEVARLSSSFNTMLSRLAAAREAQDRLVQDAAHELRTPLTSLRTNASVLRRFAELTPAAREQLLADVQGETRELSLLVDELVELALSNRPDEPEQDVALADVAAAAADRVRRRSGRTVTLDADTSVVRGRRQALERAVGNLLENAAKFDDSDEAIEVVVRDGTTTVRDHGPGVAPDDVERIFDRFYRADAARSRPGSGLGLAIVRDVAESHDGSAFVLTPRGGGALLGLSVGPGRLLPASEAGHAGSSPGTSSVGGP